MSSDPSAAWVALVRPASLCAICLNDDRALLVVGACGHTVCAHCLLDCLYVSTGGFLASGGIPSSAYIAPPPKCTTAPGVHCDLCLPTQIDLNIWAGQYWNTVRSRTPRPIPVTPSAPLEADPFFASLGSPVGLVHASVFTAIKDWANGDDFARKVLGPATPGVELQPLHDVALRFAEDAANLATLSQPPAPGNPLLRAPSEVAPALCSCGALVAVDAHAVQGSAKEGVHVTCFECGTGLCAVCGLVWDVIDVSHTGVTCNDLPLLRIDNEQKIKEYSLDTKLCPNPDCRIPVFHKFGHACHSVTCKRCSWSFCYVCLLTSEEKTSANHGGCPSTCNAACGCAPCPDCIPDNCDECRGNSAGEGCITCRLGHRPETGEETVARLARHAVAVAERKGAYPEWPGPRRFRPTTDRPASRIVSLVGALPFTRGALRSPANGVNGAAALAREGLQLLVHAAKEMGIFGTYFLTVANSAGLKSRYIKSDVVVVNMPDGSPVDQGSIADGYRDNHVVLKPLTPPLVLQIGARVRRGAQWAYGSQDEALTLDDGIIRVFGTVIRSNESGEEVTVHWDSPRDDENNYAQGHLEVVLTGEFPIVGSVVRSSAGSSLTGVLACKDATATVVPDQNIFIDAPPNLMCVFDEALKVLQYAIAAEHDAAKARGASPPAGVAFADGVPALRSMMRPSSSWLNIQPKLSYGNDCKRDKSTPSFMDIMLKIIRSACDPGVGARQDVALVALTALTRAIEVPAGTTLDEGAWDDTSRLRAERRASIALELLSLEGLEALADVFALGREGEAEAAHGLQTTFAGDGFSYRFFLTPSRHLGLHEIDFGGDDAELPFDRILHVTELLLRGDGRTLVISVEGDTELRELVMSKEDAVERIAVIAGLAAKASPQVPISGIAKRVVAQASSKAEAISTASRPSGKRRIGIVGAGRLAVAANAIVDSIANDIDVLDALFSWGVVHSEEKDARTPEFVSRVRAVFTSLWESAHARVPGAANLAVLWAATVAPRSIVRNSPELLLGPWAGLQLHFGENPTPLFNFTSPNRMLFAAPPKGFGREQLLSLEVVDAVCVDKAPEASPASSGSKGANQNAGLSDDDAIAFAISASMSGDETLHSHHSYCCACKRPQCALPYGPREVFFATEKRERNDLSAQHARLKATLVAVTENPALHAHTELVRRAAFRASTGRRSHMGNFRTFENRQGFSCSLQNSGDETGPLCTHGGIIGAEHWSCCGQTTVECECTRG